MPRDDEPNLQAAFAELHRRERAAAPPLSAMRQRAINQAGDRRFSARSATGLPWLAGASAAICVATVALWWSGRVPVSTPANTLEVASAQRVEQLLTSIEQHFEFDEVISSSSYPTDALLTQAGVDLSP